MASLPAPLDVRRGLTEASSVSRPLRWGILGASDISSDWIKCLKEVPGAELVAVAARNVDRAKEFASAHGVLSAYGNYSDLFDDNKIDVVYIGTITPTHKDLSLRAIAAGKHVVCEKPLAETLADAEEMYHAAEAKGVMLQEGMWQRFFPAVDKARELMEDGSIGDVSLVRSEFPDPCYAVQAAPFAFGTSSFRGVVATGPFTSGRDASAAVAQFDAGCAMFSFPKWDCEYPEKIEIIGSKGCLSLEQWGHCPTRLVVSLTPEQCLQGPSVLAAEGARGAAPHTSTSQCGVQPILQTYDYPLPEPAGVPDPNWHFSNQHGFLYQAQAIHRCIAAGLKQCPQYTKEESLLVMSMLDDITQTKPLASVKRRRIQTIQVIIVGAGRMGKYHADSLINIEGCRIVAVVDPMEEAASTLAATCGASFYNELASALQANPDADAVVIATPAGLHKSNILEAAASKKHIFVEKPFTLTVEEGIECVNAIKAAGVLCQVGFMRRFDTAWGGVKSQTGKVGKLQMVRVRHFDGCKSTDSYYKTSGGIFLDMSCHDLDLICFLAGSRPTHVNVMGSVTVNPVFESFGDIDTAVTCIRFANGAVGWIENLRFAVYGFDTQVEVIGSEGSVKAGPMNRTEVQCSSADGVNHGPLTVHYDRYLATFFAEMESFIRSCRAGELDPTACNADDGFLNIKLAHACMQARSEGRTVEIAS